jgi:hypothetical protein
MKDFYNFENINSFKSQTNSFWIKYEEIISKMSKEELTYISKQENVINAKNNLINTFIDYLFDREKNNFISSSDMAKSVADDYINNIQLASSNYVSRTELLENENAELKKKISELLSKGDVKKNDNNKQITTT